MKFHTKAMRLVSVSAVSAATLFLVSTPARSAGFAISNQGAVGMGNAYAGAGAAASDVSTAWANPAAMMELSAPMVGVAASVTTAKSDFEDRGSTTNPAFGSEPLSGVGTASLSHSTFIPNFYYARPMSDTWAIGLSISAPFGTSSEYDTDWVGRYHATNTEVSAIDINPTVAYRINDKVSIGGGISVQLSSATLGNNIDSGASCFGLASLGAFNTVDCVNAQMAPNVEALDSSAEITGDGTAFTFNIGALFKPREDTKIGVAYRHGTDHEIEGDTDFTVNPALAGVLEANGQTIFSDTDSTVKASLPATFDLSIAHQFRPKIELLGSLLWTRWSSFDKLTADFDNAAQPQSAITFDWEDAIRASAGFNYLLNEQLTLRAGVAYDQSPVPNPRRRSPRGPANDRYWFSFGGSYQFNQKASLHAGFAYVAIDSSAIDNTGDAPGAPTLRGEYDLSATLAGVQFNWNF